MSVTEEIKQRLDIVELISASGVQLRKAGRNFTGFCPFHPNARTPAFYVFPDTQSYYCFSCHKSGDAFTYVMEREGAAFGDVLEKLAQQAGVQLPERSSVARDAQEQEEALHAKLRQINEDTAVYWNHLLRNTAKGELGRDYVARRELSAGTVESWQLGFAPDDWGDLLRYLTDRKGYTPDEIEQAGLAIKREGGGYYDRFRNRLMFPIRDQRGVIVGFGGRTLGDDHAKYMNTPETPIFHKSNLLFGLYQAREMIRSGDSVVVVEGYLDVISTHQAGFANVVAPMGTALTAEQVQTIRKLLSKNGTIFLALDADEAGNRAAQKGVDAIMQTGSRELIQLGQYDQAWEADLDLPLKIIQLPAGKDPDDIARNDGQQWRDLVANALPIVDYFFMLYTRGLDLRQPDDQQRALTTLAPIVASLKDIAKRAVYESRLADLLRMPFALIQSSVLAITRQSRQRVSGYQRVSTPTRPDPAARVLDPWRHEDELLSLLMRFPKIQDRVVEMLTSELATFPDLRDDMPSDLHEVFTRTENRLVWYAWSEHGSLGPSNRQSWLDALDPTLRTHAERLLQWNDEPPLPTFGAELLVQKTADGLMRRLKKQIVQRRCEMLNEMARSVEDEQDRAQLEHKSALVLHYRNTVTAPRPSTVYADLGSRRDDFG